MDADDRYMVYGVEQSFFTRKLTGYLDYKGIPWRWRRGLQLDPEVRAAGWNGGIPAVKTPDGEIIWDTTSLILHFETLYPERSVLPDDTTLLLLAFVIEDFNDEWLYRPAVSTRWLYPENAISGGFDLARSTSKEAGSGAVPIEMIVELVRRAMTDSIYRVGGTPQTAQAWRDDLKQWSSVTSALFATRPYLFGARPSITDFALFGGNIAHFVNDPLCRKWVDESGPGVVGHTMRLLEPWDESFGDWDGAIIDELVDVLAFLGRNYLPWVAEATREGAATVNFANGESVEIATTNFLNIARGQMLARYRELRTDAADEILERAGILSYYADYLDQAGSLPDPTIAPKPGDNRPYPAER